jgi:hypothetical protein
MAFPRFALGVAVSLLAASTLGACLGLSELSAGLAPPSEAGVVLGAAPLAAAPDAGAPPEDAGPPTDATGRAGTGNSEDRDAASPSDADAPAPIRFVQANASTSTTVNLQAEVTAHDAILVAADVWPLTTTFVSATDTLGNHYEVVAGPYDAVGARLYLLAAYDVAGGRDAVQLAFDGLQAGSLQVAEYAGLAAADALDTSDTVYGTTDEKKTAEATILTTTPGDLLFAFYEAHGTMAAAPALVARSTAPSDLIEDQVTGPPGLQKAGVSMTVANLGWSAIVATFKPR